MKRSTIMAYAALALAAALPLLGEPEHREMAPHHSAEPTVQIAVTAPAETVVPAAAETAAIEPEALRVLMPDGSIADMDMQSYLIGVLSAEMPASFPMEALKAQAVAARTYARYTMRSNKHGEADICADYGCCQAWKSDEQMRADCGESYEECLGRISAAVESTAGQSLVYGGEPVFAAFHSSSAGKTESCGRIWGELPYLVSVDSPESARDVPNYVTQVKSSAIDLRDTVLYRYPDADFTGDKSQWLSDISYDESGRVAWAELGGVKISGTELRSLFKLRSTAFSIEYSDGVFTFTVTGSGHGVGMSQYGAKVLAEEGLSYAEILAHYYQGTELIAY